MKVHYKACLRAKKLSKQEHVKTQADKYLQANTKGLDWNKFLFRDQEKEEVYRSVCTGGAVGHLLLLRWSI